MDLVAVDKRRLSFEITTTPTISDTLVVTNIAPHTVTFKVKTNNQERYIVRPNVGRIEANSNIAISVLFHPSAPLPTTTSSNDKFLLRIAPILPNQYDSLTEFWIQNESSSDVRGIRFRVDFVFPDDFNLTFPSPNNDENENENENIMASPPTSPEHIQGKPTLPLLPSQQFQQQQKYHDEDYDQDQVEPIISTLPHVRDLPPDLLQQQQQQQQQQQPITEMQPSSQTTEQINEEEETITHEEALSKVNRLQSLLDEKNLELSRLKTELEETRAQTETVLNHSPVTPIAANSILSDPFGGVSITGFGLMLFLIALIISIILRK